MAYNADGKFAEALAALEKGEALAPDWLELQGELASTHALAGNREQAKNILEKALAMSAGGYINEVVVASVYLDLGDNDEAIAWLERGYQNRCSWMRWISIEPKLDKLRSDPRFQDLVRRIGTI
jgi:tetratricopeptide (TPR) repeat protein